MGSSSGRGGSSQRNMSSIDMKKAEQFFTRLQNIDGKEKEQDKIQQKAIEALLNDLGLDPVSRQVLVFAWKCQAKKQCIFTKDEFFKGLADLGYCLFRTSFIRMFI